MAEISRALSRLGLKAEEVSQKSRLPLERVNELLSGSSVSFTELRALARGLKLPLRAFSTDAEVATSSHRIRFRNTRARAEHDPTNERVSAYVEAALSSLPLRQEVPFWLEPFWAAPHSSFEDAENAAEALRSLLYPDRDLEPAIGLPQRLHACDGVILGQLNNSQYEGASVVAGGYVFLFVSPRFSGRMLFTLSHELGHVVAKHCAGEPHYDRAGDIGRYKSAQEGYSDAFASAFLMPPRAVGVALRAIRESYNIRSDEIGDVEIIVLSRFFGVSFDVAARRLEILRLLPPGGAFSLSEKVKKDHGNAEKRAEALRLPPRQAAVIDTISPVLTQATSKSILEGELSPTWIAERLGVSVEQLQRSNMQTGGRARLAH